MGGNAGQLVSDAAMPGLAPHLDCVSCHHALQAEAGASIAQCPACRTRQLRFVFPALAHGPLRGRQAEPVMTDGESCCYYHADNRAVASCDSCGRFVCSVCEIAVGQSHICPVCFQAAAGLGVPLNHTQQLVERRVQYDRIAFLAIIAPLALCIPVTLVTAPFAAFMALKHLRMPPGVLPRGNAKAIFSLTAATLVILGWIAGGVVAIGSLLV